MQNLGLSQPQADAADIASGWSMPMDQQSQPSQGPQRPAFLEDHDQFDIGTPIRGSVATSGYATPVGSHSEYLARITDAIADYDKQQKAKEEAKNKSSWRSCRRSIGQR